MATFVFESEQGEVRFTVEAESEPDARLELMERIQILMEMDVRINSQFKLVSAY